MGVIAEALATYAQPLLEQTDGSPEQMDQAFAISQLCYNLALLPEDQRETTLREMQPRLHMTDAEFETFWFGIAIPMIQRHEEMFPQLHQRASVTPWQNGFEPLAEPKTTTPAQRASLVTDRYAPCPCGSGEKYKFCCGKKPR